MVAPGAFPLVKLAALAVRQIAKPLANAMKARAKTSPFFRNYVCMPPAQFYHWMDVNVRMRMLNLGKPKDVKKLDENAAIELGADLLGETIIFVVAATTLTLEYIRQSRNSAKAAAELEERWQRAEQKIDHLEQSLLKVTEGLEKQSQKGVLPTALQEARVLLTQQVTGQTWRWSLWLIEKKCHIYWVNSTTL